MSEYRSEPSIKELISGVLDDTRELIREEIALARAELREELSKARTAAIALTTAVMTGVIGVVMLCVAAGGALADALDWPAWGGYGIVALMLLGAALALVAVGRKRLASIRPLPKTMGSLRENVEWVQTASTTLPDRTS